MGVVLRFISTLTLFAFLLLFSFSAAASLHRFREGHGQGKKETARLGLPGGIVEQKKLGRSGSMPPNCRSKCGKCKPCKAVHVPMQQGRPIMPLEYYPAAWWCKCGNKLFVP